LIIQIIKNHHHFNQELCEYLMKKKIYQIYYLINIIFIQSNVLRVILGQDIPFVYPSHEWTPFISVFWFMCLFHVIMLVHMSYILLGGRGICQVMRQHLKQTHTYELISWILCILFNGKPKVKGFKPSHTYWLPQWALGL
jgi:hypothetical protein